MVGIRIKELRLDNDKKIKEIAKVLNVKLTTYSSWENMQNEMPLIKLNELANYYKTSFDYILGLSNFHEVIKEKQEIDLKKLSSRLSEIRKERKLTQSFLGKKIGLPQTTYSQYERGLTIPTSLKLLVIAEYYNISIDYLVGRINAKKRH